MTLNEARFVVVSGIAVPAAGYAIKTAQDTDPGNAEAGRIERVWERQTDSGQVRDLMLEDQARRNDICWSVFAD